jgi:hypothetical protein
MVLVELPERQAELGGEKRLDPAAAGEPSLASATDLQAGAAPRMAVKCPDLKTTGKIQ